MPVLSRRTRRLLRLLILPRRGKRSRLEFALDGLVKLIVFLWPVGIMFYLCFWDGGQYRQWAWAPVIYLYFERALRNAESEAEHTRAEMRKLMKSFSKTEIQLGQMRHAIGMFGLGNGRVKVDVNDFATEAQKWGRNQAAHQARRR